MNIEAWKVKIGTIFKKENLWELMNPLQGTIIVNVITISTTSSHGYEPNLMNIVNPSTMRRTLII
jgi:hypothetical protein